MEEGTLNDVNDELVAGLKLVADLLKKAAADQLQALLSGELKLAIVPKNWKPPTKIPPVPTVRAQLIEAPDSAARIEILSAFEMNATQARKLAKDLGVMGAGRLSADEAITRISRYFADAATT